MGKYFSDAVDSAIEAIYYTYDRDRAAAALQPLADAANAGDGDAAYILSRCTSGPQYSWDYHPFQADDGVTEQLIRQSLQGQRHGRAGGHAVRDAHPRDGGGHEGPLPQPPGRLERGA